MHDGMLHAYRFAHSAVSWYILRNTDAHDRSKPSCTTHLIQQYLSHLIGDLVEQCANHIE
jgi:hypothetical protein